MSRPTTPVNPWLPLVIPPIAWLLFEYGLGTALGHHCHAVGSWLGLSWGGLSLIACLVAAVIARRVAGAADDALPRPWLGRIALLGAAVFALAILYQTLATLIVPPCAH